MSTTSKMFKASLGGGLRLLLVFAFVSLAVFAIAPAEADVVLTGDTAEEAPVTAPGSPIPLNPRATYLRTNADPAALDAAPIDLSSLGLIPGELVYIKRLGDFAPGPSPEPDTEKQATAVFSSTPANLLGSSNLNRVVGAVRDPTDGTQDQPTSPTAIGDLATDIAEDFRINDGVVARMAASATHLFVSVRDSFFGDNADPDSDWALQLSRPQVIGDSAIGTLTVDTPGANNFTRDVIVIANEAGSFGSTVTVDGAGATLTANDHIYAGLNDRGEMQITNGGTANTQFINVGRGTTSVESKLTVTGTGSTLNLTSTLGDNPFFGAFLTVGRNSKGTAEITNGGRVVIEGGPAILRDSR